MGRVRTKFVKRLSSKLLDIHGKEFSASFDENKQKVQDLTDVSTKKLRNMIAGFITKKVKTLED